MVDNISEVVNMLLDGKIIIKIEIKKKTLFGVRGMIMMPLA